MKDNFPVIKHQSLRTKVIPRRVNIIQVDLRLVTKLYNKVVDHLGVGLTLVSVMLYEVILDKDLS
jgi:hypothetical protein